MSEDEPQTEGMKALEQSLNDHMEICRLQRKAKRLKAENAQLKAQVEQLCKAGDKMAKTLEKDQQRYNGCPSPEAEMWWIARDGGCP